MNFAMLIFTQNKKLLYFLLVWLLVTLLSVAVHGIGEVVWAVNCGGDSHTDAHGIRYQKDYSVDGISSDYGKGLVIARIQPQDQILYQTERYDTDTFGYNIPIKQDGDYVLVLKFSEVWFANPLQKVFDVLLNHQHIVVDQIDIYSKVGRGVAHDEVIPFKVNGGELRVQGEESVVEGGMISVEFIKGDRDNPKINAMYLMKGTLEDVPKLPPLPRAIEDEEDEEEEEEEPVHSKPQTKKKIPSQPKVQDPYASDDTASMLFPIVIAVAAFFPLVFCLCKL